MKTCTKCCQNLPDELFYKDVRKSGGLASNCKLCHKSAEKVARKARISGDRDRVPHGTPRGYSGWGCRCEPCKVASAQYQRAWKYGVSWERYERMVRDQDGKCAVCEEGCTDFQIDHDHSCCPGNRSCGACVRKLLCPTCNRGIGMFYDNPDILLAAAAYLLQSRNVLEEL